MLHYEWDDIKTKGFSSLLYKLYLGLTYPVRHPFVTIVVLLAFYRHELGDMWFKYQHKMPEPVQQALEQAPPLLSRRLSAPPPFPLPQGQAESA